MPILSKREWVTLGFRFAYNIKGYSFHSRSPIAEQGIESEQNMRPRAPIQLELGLFEFSKALEFQANAAKPFFLLGLFTRVE